MGTRAAVEDDALAPALWIMVGDGADLPDGSPVIVTLERWRSEREALLRRDGALGIRLRSDQSPDQIAEDLERFDLVVLDRPELGDGAGRWRDPAEAAAEQEMNTAVCAAYWAY